MDAVPCPAAPQPPAAPLAADLPCPAAAPLPPAADDAPCPAAAPLTPAAEGFLRVLTCLAQRGFAPPLSLVNICRATRDDAQLWDAIVHFSSPAPNSPRARTHLMHAARQGCLPRVRFLLARGARVDAHPAPPEEVQEQPLSTALFEASAKGHVAVVAALLAAGADARNGLHIAAACGKEAVLPLLVAGGCEVDLFRSLCPSQCATSPLCHAAAAVGHCEPGKEAEPLAVMRCLLSLGASTERAMHCASAGGRSAAALELLLAHRAAASVAAASAAAASAASASAGLRDGTALIHTAARCGSEAGVRLLLAADSALASAAEAGNFMPLMMAAQRGQIGIVRALLAAGANVNARYRAQQGGGGGGAGEGAGDQPAPDGDAALHFAAYSGHADVVRELCGAGAEVEAVSLPSGCTPLLVAMLNWHEAAVGALLDRGASASATCANGYTPIMLAAHPHGAEGEGEGKEEAVAVRLCAALCAAGGDVNAARLQGTHPDGCTALMFASEDGRLGIVRELLRQGARVDAMRVDKGLTALYFAAQEGRTGTVEALLAAGARASVAAPDGFSALMSAARGGHLGIARALIAAGASVNARCRAQQEEPDEGAGGAAAGFQGSAALHFAAASGHADVVRELCGAGAEVEAVSLPSGCTPLLAAMEKWHEPAVTALLGAGASASATCANGFTAIMLAAHPHGAEGEGEGEEAVAVRLCAALCAAGGDVHAARLQGPHPDGCTALMFACEMGRLGIARILLRQGARVDAKRVDNGLTALFFAAYKGRASTVELLLAAGACPSVAAWQNGVTALMVAAQTSTACTRLLLAAGADFRARDVAGRMAPHYAARSRATMALFVGLSF